MIQFSIDDDGDIAALMSRFQELPNHIARKHMQAAIRRVMKFAVPHLKRNTPKRRSYVRFGGGRGGREYTATKIKGGSLRRSVITKASYIRSKADGGGVAYGSVGYSRAKAPAESSQSGITQSRKAIWLEFGTEFAFARGMVAMTMKQIGKPAAGMLATELAAALEKAANELASKKNPGMSKRGLAAGAQPRG